MANYYQEILRRIKKLIQTGNIEEALALLEEELNQTFIPKRYEEEFISLYQDLKFKTEEPRAQEGLEVISDQETLARMLDGELEYQILAMLNLEQLNIRNYREIIYNYFKTSQDAIVKGRLLEVCVEQGLEDTILYQVDDHIIDVDLSELTLLSERESTLRLIKKLNEYFFKRPSELELAMSRLVELLYMSYPLDLNRGEQEKLFDLIVEELGENLD